MKKTTTTVTPAMIRAFFDGVITTAEADAVRELLDSVIADLVAENNATIESITVTLRDKHGFEVSESCVSDYFQDYAEKYLPDLFGYSL